MNLQIEINDDFDIIDIIVDDSHTLQAIKLDEGEYKFENFDAVGEDYDDELITALERVCRVFFNIY